MTFRPLQDTQQMLGSLQDELNRVFDRVWHVGLSTPPLDGQKWAPAVDLYEYDDRYVIVAEAPGLDADAIEVSQLGETLTIRGDKKKPSVAADAIATLRSECRCGPFCRTIDFPPGAAKERVSARCHNGLLEITVPKKETTKPRTIKVHGEATTDPA
jgi:HSP20 family protein